MPTPYSLLPCVSPETNKFATISANQVEQGWQLSANRLWVHTCTLDHAAALPNYLKRGFKPFRQETYVVTVEDVMN